MPFAAGAQEGLKKVYGKGQVIHIQDSSFLEEGNGYNNVQP